MKSLIDYIKKDWIGVMQNLVILIAAIGIAVSPFIVDYSTLPKGYELPKVLFYQIICSVIIIFSLFIELLKIKKTEKIKIHRSFSLMLVISLLFLISTFLSSHVDTAIWGNSFRLQGVITYLLMIWAAYGVYLNITKVSWNIIALSFIFSTIIQCGVAFNQFNQLVRINPNSILEGVWVNGTFGQANWFAGRILISVIFCAFYFGLRLQRNKTLRIIFKLYFGLLILFFLIILGLTQSEWGIISGVFAIFLILSYEILTKKIFIAFVTFIIVAGAIGATVFLKINTEYNLRIDILNSIITILTQPFNLYQLKIISFGFGFDTLGEVFKDYGLIKGLLVDRAHNFVLDIIIQNGFIVFGIFVFLITKLFRNLFNNNKDRILDFTFIALIAWMFRSVIHENGIVNLMDFLFILSICLSLASKKLHSIHGINSKKS